MTNPDSAKGLELQLPKGLALEPPKGLALEPTIPVEPPPSLVTYELVGDGPTLDPWDETFVCEIDDLY